MIVDHRQMARAVGIEPGTFREALWREWRRGRLKWHRPWGRWKARKDSPEYLEMAAVLDEMMRRKQAVRRRA